MLKNWKSTFELVLVGALSTFFASLVPLGSGVTPQDVEHAAIAAGLAAFYALTKKLGFTSAVSSLKQLAHGPDQPPSNPGDHGRGSIH